uniref:Uncharacterized protein n=1 Tax=Arundo donax TaxID=35708 RepID=A0A0A8ZWR6_ARUDO
MLHYILCISYFLLWDDGLYTIICNICAFIVLQAKSDPGTGFHSMV